MSKIHQTNCEIREKEPQRKTVYTDETWINENHCDRKEWVDLEALEYPYHSLKNLILLEKLKKSVVKTNALLLQM